MLISKGYKRPVGTALCFIGRSHKLGGPVNRLNVIQSLLHHFALGSAIVRPYLALSREWGNRVLVIVL